MDVRTKRTRAEVTDILTHLRQINRGTSDKYRFRDVFYETVAYSMFDSAYIAYVQKSSGGSDDLGNSWAPLKPATIAYSKPNWRAQLALPYGSPIRPTLTQAQDKIWRTIFVHRRYATLGVSIDVGLAAYRARRRAVKVLNKLSQDEANASQDAARLAWNILKKKFGATTLIALAQDAVVPVMKETGTLLASIDPSSKKDKFIIARPGELRLGSTVPHTIAFRRRPLWPANYKPWLDRAVAAGKEAVQKRLVEVLTA